MILTEDEARKRWCPFARVALFSGPSDFLANGNNRETELKDNGFTNRVIPGAKCIASECMAWRWRFVDRTTEEVRASDGSVAVHLDLDYTLGFCGLAGKP